MGSYIVNVKFDRNSSKNYLCNDIDEAKRIARAAERFNLEYEVLLEHKGYQEVIYFLD